MPPRIAARIWLGAFDFLCRHPRLPGTRPLLLAAIRRATSAAGRRVPDARDSRPLALAAMMRRAARSGSRPPSCLAQALALHRLLAAEGLPARVRLGLEPRQRPRSGHAWVECGGVPVGDDPSLVARYRACRTS